MLKENKKTLALASIVTMLPALAGVFLWNRLPDAMATHFGANNEADGFSSKAFAVFGLPLILLAVLWVSALVISQDPKKQNISPKLFSLGIWIVPVVSLAGALAQYPYNLGYRMDITYAVELLLGVIFAVVGIFLPKVRQNYSIGIKLPWTLANEENWNRTHRLAGYVWTGGGILLVILSFAQWVPKEWMIAIFIMMALVPSVYSFWLHAKKNL